MKVTVIIDPERDGPEITITAPALADTIRITLAEETVCYVSRRYVKKIREALGL